MITNMSVASGFAVGFGLVSLWLVTQLIGWVNDIAEEVRTVSVLSLQAQQSSCFRCSF